MRIGNIVNGAIMSLGELNRSGFSIVEIDDTISDIDSAHFDYLKDSLSEIMYIDKHAARLFRSLIKLGGSDILNDIRLEKFVDTYVSIENANYPMIVSWIRELQLNIDKKEQLNIILNDIISDLDIINIYLLLEALTFNKDVQLCNKLVLYCRSNKVLIRSFKSGKFKFDIDREELISIVYDCAKNNFKKNK